MAMEAKPDLKRAQKVLPVPLFTSLCHVFAQGIRGCVLAGGTALAGFYAGHRRSDDLDLFAVADPQQRATVLAVKSLVSVGVDLKILNESAQYFEAAGRLAEYAFKITVVLDPNLFRVGIPVLLSGNVQVVDLETLFKMKAATLVSRCSEKDLYDLIWLFGQYPMRGFGDLIRLGSEYDGGLSAENILSSLAGADLRKDACGFSLDRAKTSARIFREILGFRRKLLAGLTAYLEDEPAPTLGALIRKLEALNKK